MGDDATRHVAKVLSTCTAYILLSGGLINFNKYLVHEKRFPHAMHLTCCHMIGSILLALILYAIIPSMFPGMERTRGKKREVYKWLVPIGILFAFMLFGSNKAYLYCSVAFLQFMKEWNVAVVFILSYMCGLQTMNRQRLFIIAWIILGGCLCVSGDLHFAIVGFMYQFVSQLCECMRAVFAEIVLNGELKLDPLSYTMLVAPVCVVVLAVGSILTWDATVWIDFKEWWPFIVPNVVLAFVLNVCIALLIKETSAVGFLLTGIMKDVALVILSSVLFSDPITRRQWACFLFTVSGVIFWSFTKLKPEHTIVRHFEKLLGVPEAKIVETTPLVLDADKKV